MQLNAESREPSAGVGDVKDVTLARDAQSSSQHDPGAASSVSPSRQQREAGAAVILRRVGVLVPPENPTVEPEMVTLLGPDTAMHVARLSLTRGADLHARLDGYRAGLAPTVQQFGELELAAIFVACTGSFYGIGPEADERLCAALSAEFGTPVRSATRVIADTLRARGCRRIFVVSPYPSWLTEAACSYWAGAGLEVTGIAQVANGRPIYSITASDMLTALEAAAETATAVDAILVTGTGVPTAAAIGALQPKARPILLSSNLCGAWWLSNPTAMGLEVQS